MRAFRLRKKKASRSARAPPDRMDRTLLARCVSGRRCPIGPLALRASLKKPEFVAAAIGHAADNAIGMPSACFRPMHAWRKGLDGALAKRAIACWTRVRVFLDGSRSACCRYVPPMKKRPVQGACARLNEARRCCGVVQRTTAVRSALAPVGPGDDVDPHREHENAALHDHLPVRVDVEHRHAVIEARHHQRADQRAIHGARAAAH